MSGNREIQEKTIRNFLCTVGTESHFNSLQLLMTHARYSWSNPKALQYCFGCFIYQSLGHCLGFSLRRRQCPARREGPHRPGARLVGKPSCPCRRRAEAGPPRCPPQAPPPSAPATPVPSRAAPSRAPGGRDRRRGPGRQQPRQAGRREGAERR